MSNGLIFESFEETIGVNVINADNSCTNDVGDPTATTVAKLINYVTDVKSILVKLDEQTDTLSYLNDLNADIVGKGLMSKAKAKLIDEAHPDLDFSRQFKPMVTQKIVLVNELFLVDIDETIELTKQFYMYRHNCMYCCDPIPYLHQDTAVLDFFGISKVFSPDTIKVIAENNSKLTCYVNKFCNILEKLKD